MQSLYGPPAPTRSQASRRTAPSLKHAPDNCALWAAARRPVVAVNSNSSTPLVDTAADVKPSPPDPSPPRHPGGPPNPRRRPAAGAAAGPPPVAFTRTPGAPAPAAYTAAAAAAAIAAAAATSKNVNVSPRYRPFLDAWDQGFEFNARDEPWGIWLQVTEGELPAELVGTLFRNGPGRFARGPDSYRHPYDGDGLVTSVAFTGDGRAFFRSAFVRTLEHEAEDLAGRVLFRGAISTRRRRGGGLLGNLGDLTLRNAANGGVVLQGGRLLALYPAGLPYALDPATLATRGSDLLGGALSPGVPLSLGSPSADRAVGRLHRLLGSNDQLPTANSCLGGDACTGRPRTCGITGHRVFWSHRTLLRGMPTAASPAAGGADVSEEEQRLEAGTTAAAAAAAGPPVGESGGAGAGEGDGFDAVAWLGAAARWLRRPPQERFETLLTFWEVQPGEPLGPGPRQQQQQQHQDADLDQVSAGEPQRQQQEHQKRPPLSVQYRVTGFAAPAVNDVAVTANYYLFVQPPIHPEVLPYVLGESGPLGCLRWREGEAAVLHAVPRPGSEAERRGERPRQLPLSPAVFILHHVNAFEDESGRLVLDSVAYDSLPAVGAQPLPEQAARLTDPDAGCKARLQRLVVDLTAGAITRGPVPGDAPLEPATSPARHRHLELPAINTAYTGRRYRYVYGCSAVFEDASCGVVKADMDTMQTQRWAPGPGYICLEPCFVPRLAPAARGLAAGPAGRRPPVSADQNPHADGAAAAPPPPPPPAVAMRQRSEDDGWLLVYGFDSRARRSELLVFDAWALMAGPVARLALPNPLPHGLYGTWADEYFGPRL